MSIGRNLPLRSALGGAMLLSIAALAVPSPAAAAASGTRGPAGSLPVQSCPSGVELTLPTSSSFDADGWLRMDYDLGGVHGYTEIPPVGFDVRSAPPELLARHHIEVPAPQSDSALDQLIADSRRVQWVRTQGRCGPVPITFGTYKYSANWGGDAVLFTGAYGFVGVKAYQKQAPLTSDCGSKSSLGSWVGLGGTYSSNAFLQAGTFVLGSGWGSWAGYHAFWEYFDSWGTDIYDVQFLNVPVAANDTIFEYVTQITDNTGFVEVYNQTQYTVDTFYVTTPNSQGLRNSAEWIDERTPGGTLNKYGWTSWWSMYVMRSNSGGVWSGVYSEPNEWWYYMRQGSTYLSKTTGTYSDNHMKNRWYACGTAS